MNYIGIDLSLTGTGIVVIDEENKILIQELVSTNSKDNIEIRFSTIVDKVLLITSQYPENKICIEGLSFGSQSSSMLQLAGLHFLVRYILTKANIKYEIVPPTVLKKWVTGKGQSKKELMLLQCYKKFGEEFSDNNICDAYLLSKFSKGN